ncbi:MAG: THxN family PEP-CTERM protein [Thalassotalea sp.]
MNNLKSFKKALGMMSLALVCSSANAGQIVTEWDFSTWAEFTGSTFSTGNGATTQLANELSWGWDDLTADFTNATGDASTNRSAITLGTGTIDDTRLGGGAVSGSIDTYINGSGGTDGMGISATHWNNPLNSAFSTLTSGILTDYLTLQASSPYVGSIEDAPTLAIDFKFLETPNNGTAGVCLNGVSTNAYPSGCPDIFGFESSLTTGIPFEYDENVYGLNILVFDADGNAATFSQLGAGYCGALGLSDTCVGLVTAENATTSFQFGVNINYLREASVPEPSTLLLLAGGLMLVGASKRKINVLK